MTQPQHELFSSVLEERWSEISNFPGYNISDAGRVLNQLTGKLLRITVNAKNLCMVGLSRDGKQHKRSLPLLVAREFVPAYRDRLEFDTPINLDGDRNNNHYTNLAWRPLWFARRYHAQFLDDHNSFDTPIEDVETGEVYKNSMHAAMVNGLLDNEIYVSMLNNTYVWPTGQVFRQAINP